MGKHTVKPKYSKWMIAAFSYILDVACVNASALSRMNTKTNQGTIKVILVWLGDSNVIDLPTTAALTQAFQRFTEVYPTSYQGSFGDQS